VYFASVSQIDMAGPWVTEDDIAIVVDMLRNGWYGKDSYTYVEKFESEFSKWHNRNHGLMTPNCTTAIHLILTAMGIGPGDEVIVPDITWIASAAPIVYLGATPVFADVDPDNWTLTVSSIMSVLTPKTKAVIAVDVYGNMPELHQITKFCAENNLFLIEDAAEALGSKLNKDKAGSFGDASVFSFHRTKTLTTGEGGMLIMNDEKLFLRSKFLRDHGRAPGTYFNTEVTYKYMPSNLAGALGFAQLQRVEELIEKKRWILANYSRLLGDLPGIRLNPEPNGVTNSAWSTVLLADVELNLTASTIMAGLDKRNLPIRPFFYPLTFLPAFKSFVKNVNYSRVNTNSYSLNTRGVCLPSALNMSLEKIHKVSQGVREIYFENF
jgi:perosamine synthetase